MKAYPEYKDSGVEWLGKVPKTWQVGKLGRAAKLQGGYAFSSEIFSTDGVPLLRMNNLKEGRVDVSDAVRIPEDFIVASVALNAGDLVWGMSGSIGNFARISESDLPCLLNQRVGRFVTDDDLISADFIEYIIQSEFYRQQIMLLVTGTAQLNISSEQVQSCIIALPPLTEQRKIAAFLDLEVAKIDDLIEEQRRLIALLAEKRQATISHAVTKGLNPNAKLKPSGIDWLGDVPEGWDVVRLKYLADNIKAGPFGSALTKDMYVQKGYRVYGQEQVIPNDFSVGDYYITAEKFEELAQYQALPNDILISCVGTFGKIAIFPFSAEAGIINPRLIRFRPNKLVTSEFLCELLRSSIVAEQFSFLSRGGTMDIISIGTLSDIVLPLPPVEEQIAIFLRLAAIEEDFGNLTETAQASITLLQERRSALISAAVTGKIDLRDFDDSILA